MKAPRWGGGGGGWVGETTGEVWWTDEVWQVSASNNQLRADLQAQLSD